MAETITKADRLKELGEKRASYAWMRETATKGAAVPDASKNTGPHLTPAEETELKTLEAELGPFKG